MHTATLNGQLPFSCRRVPERPASASVCRHAVDHYRQAVARRRFCNTLAYGVAWAATVVVPAALTVLHG